MVCLVGHIINVCSSFGAHLLTLFAGPYIENSRAFQCVCTLDDDEQEWHLKLRHPYPCDDSDSHPNPKSPLSLGRRPTHIIFHGLTFGLSS